MGFKDTPIQRKLMIVILLTSGAVLLLTGAAYVTYEVLTFRESMVQQLSTLGKIVAANSTAALAFENQADAREVLATLKAEPHIVAAGLYDQNGNLFAGYPETLSAQALPNQPEPDGYRFAESHLITVQPVVEGGKRLGTLWLKSDMEALAERFRLVGLMAVLVMLGSFLFAFLLSKQLQGRISRPILNLAETAKAVSTHRDYSVRAEKLGADELGLLTDAFNHMLQQIQEQRQTVRETEERLQQTLDLISEGYQIIDETWCYRYLNRAVIKQARTTKAELLGKSMKEAFPGIEKTGLFEILKNCQAAQTPAKFENEFFYPNGESAWFQLSVQPIPAGLFILSQDITQRKATENRLQAQLGRLDLLNRITRAIGERQDLHSIFQVVLGSLEDHLPIDFGCLCLFDVTRQALAVTTLGPKSQALAKELEVTEQSCFPIDRNGLSRCIQGRLVYEPDLSDQPFDFPQRLVRAGLGSLVAAPLLVESNVLGALVVARRTPRSFTSPECEFLRQLSEHVALAAHQVQLHEALQQAYDDLRRTQQTAMQQERLRALGQMASGIAHDINNAVSPASLYTEFLLENEPNLSDRARRYLETIQQAIEDVAATVARMREFYRQREEPAVQAPLPANQLVQQVMDLTRARWSDMPQQKGIVVKTLVELAPDLPSIMGAESEIREALTNLIFNAVDAMPEGGTLTVRTRLTESPTDSKEVPLVQQVIIEIGDTGIGMDEETKRRCLEPFFTTKGERGTGLGLAMVYGVVKRHSAGIEIASQVGKGTTVTLSFLAPAVSLNGRPTVATPRPSRNSLPILIVDDDPLILKSLGDALENEGHRVVRANGGNQGVELFLAARSRREPFTVVITDLGMPYLDGRKVAEAVKTNEPATLVLLLTGWGQRMLEEGDIPPFVDRVLSKPPRLRELREALALAQGEGPFPTSTVKGKERA